MHRYQDLKFWTESKNFSVDIYRITILFPSEEKFGIVDQMRRAAVSVASNIAEGSSRNSNNEFKRFLSFSMGSAYELETQLEISRDLELISNEEYERLTSQLTSIIKQMAKFRSNCLQ